MQQDTMHGGLREAFEVLVTEAISDLRDGGRSAADVRGVALNDPRKDEQIQGLPSFGPFEAAIRDSEAVSRLFGAREGTRIALQLVYSIWRSSIKSWKPIKQR